MEFLTRVIHLKTSWGGRVEDDILDPSDAPIKLAEERLWRKF